MKYGKQVAFVGSAALLGVTIAVGPWQTAKPADAATTTISSSSEVKVMVSALCYRDTKRTVTVYYYSAGHGWRKYPAPKVTTTVSTHCYAR